MDFRMMRRMMRMAILNRLGPLALVLMLAGWGAGSAVAESPVFPVNGGLDTYLQWAREHSPRVAGAVAMAEVYSAQADGAGALPGLKLAWGEMIVPVETRVGPQQRVLSVSQSLPWFGTLGLREDQAAAQASAASAGLTETILAVERDVREAWNILAMVQRERGLLTAHLDLAGQIEAITRSAYEAGTAQYGQILQAEMETGRLGSRLEILDQRLARLVVQLNVVAGLDPTTSGPTAVAMSDMSATAVRSLPELLAVLDTRNPDLQALNHETENRRIAVNLAGKSGKPDLSLGVDYIMTGTAVQPDLPDSGKDAVIARIALTIPLWGGKSAAAEHAAMGDLQVARSRLSTVRLDLTTRLAEAHFQAGQSRTRVDLHQDVLLPRARQALEVTQADYESGRTSFEALIAARRDLLTLELDLLQAQTDGILARDRIDYLLGGTAAAVSSDTSTGKGDQS